MKNIPILAPSRLHLLAFLAACPWINHEHVVAVESERDLHGHGGLVLAIPGWEHSPSIARPRDILEFINSTGMQLVVVSSIYAELAVSDRLTPDEQLVAGGDPLGAI